MRGICNALRQGRAGCERSCDPIHHVIAAGIALRIALEIVLSTRTIPNFKSRMDIKQGNEIKLRSAISLSLIRCTDLEPFRCPTA